MLTDDEKRRHAQEFAFEKLIDFIEDINIDYAMKISDIFYRYDRPYVVETNPLTIFANLEFMNDLREEVEHGKTKIKN